MKKVIRANKSLGSDISDYQKWVDFDMKKYGKISDTTMQDIKKAGLSVVKDQYGDYEVIADDKVEGGCHGKKKVESGCHSKKKVTASEDFDDSMELMDIYHDIKNLIIRTNKLIDDSRLADYQIENLEMVSERLYSAKLFIQDIIA